MATEITNAGYKTVRDFIQNTWTFLELRDELGAPILRLGVGDSRVTWEHIADARVLKLQIIIKGTDAEINLPQTFASSALFTEKTGGEGLAVESFSNFTMESEGDELTVIHQLEIPQV